MKIKTLKCWKSINKRRNEDDENPLLENNVPRDSIKIPGSFPKAVTLLLLVISLFLSKLISFSVMKFLIMMIIMKILQK
jgi:hypothetical protein